MKMKEQKRILEPFKYYDFCFFEKLTSLLHDYKNLIKFMSFILFEIIFSL